MSRLRFKLGALLVAILPALAFLGGMAVQHRLGAPVVTTGSIIDVSKRTRIEFIEMPDGTQWYRVAGEAE
ncbi:MAG TPA: hypothetical protein VHC22_22935 [Pirellulales bacterium]|nr:hypothetical protein [Pirellulales bacterium]